MPLNKEQSLTVIEKLQNIFLFSDEYKSFPEVNQNNEEIFSDIFEIIKKNKHRKGFSKTKECYYKQMIRTHYYDIGVFKTDVVYLTDKGEIIEDKAFTNICKREPKFKDSQDEMQYAGYFGFYAKTRGVSYNYLTQDNQIVQFLFYDENIKLDAPAMFAQLDKFEKIIDMKQSLDDKLKFNSESKRKSKI